MKTKIFYLFILLFAFTFTACEKRDLPPDSEGPKLVTLDATLDGKAVHLAAGNISDFAGSETNYYSPESIWIFSTTLFDSSGTGQGSFRFSINNYRNGKSNLHDDIDQTIKPGFLAYEYNSKPLPGMVCITWQDTQQDYYSTFYYSQPGSKFEITAVETIMKDGIKYRKANITFNCMLGVMGDIHEFKGTAVMLFLAG
jgi:hypothetical protein